MRPFVPLLVLLLTVTGSAGEIRLEGRTFTVPDGFTVERVAGPPLVDRPIAGAWDEQGRLYVTDSSGSNEKVEKQLAEKPHRLVRLEDTDGDGTFDRSTIFADKLMFPEGVMWRDGSVYVAAPPSLWKLTDTDGDGVADERVEWFQGKTLTGCANDLHGPYPGPDGWIYWCKGAFAEQTYERPGHSPFVTRASHILRARPDGSGIEPVMTGGMDNPVDVVFTPGGERIFTTTFLQQPGGGKRDGLIHAIYGGVYGKVHNVLDGHIRTGPDVMPVLTHLGPAAPCGLTRYESDGFGTEFQDNLFACLFNMRKVTRHILVPDGATFATHDSDWLTATDMDFHPTDVIADADGSLLVIDTGGWYKLCCPTAQFPRPEELGGIYRVRKTGARPVDDPRGRRLAWEALQPAELVQLLDDPRPAVRNRAVETLGRCGKEAVAELSKAVRGARTSALGRNAVWAACRIDDPDARVVGRQGAQSDDEPTRLAALHSISVWRDADAKQELRRALQNGSAPIRRAAAEALGRIGGQDSVPFLFDVMKSPSDRVLEHSVLYALIEIAEPEVIAPRLRDENPRIQRAALIALDQLKWDGLKAERVAPLLRSPESDLRESAAWVASRHPEWGGALAGFLRERLAARDLTAIDREELLGLLGRFASDKSVRLVLAERLRDPSAPRDERLLILSAMARSALKETPDAWIDGLAEVVTGKDVELIRAAIAAVRVLPLHSEKAGALTAGLLKIGGDASFPDGLRLEALATIPGGLVAPTPAVLAFLVDHLGSERPVAERLSAADALAKAKLDRGQFLSLADRLDTLGPLELNRVLGTFEQTTDEEVGLKLIAALKRSPALASLQGQSLRARLAKFGPKVQAEAEAVYALLNVDAAQQRTRLEALLATLPAGNLQRGHAVFHGPKAACESCHAIGYVGGNLGPDLTRVGQIRTERDLLEAIVFPSASFVRSFEPLVVATKEGKVVSGLLRKDSADELVLATGANEETRIPRTDVDELRPGTVSVMPAGFDQHLTLQELADLVAFLKACK